jgi:hypothetical protein
MGILPQYGFIFGEWERPLFECGMEIVKQIHFPGCSESAGLKPRCPRKAAQLFLSVNVPNHVGIQFFGPVGVAVIGRAIGDVIVEKEFGVTIHKNHVAATVVSWGKV